MGFSDLTYLILKSITWSIFGFFIYYLLTFIKVHLIWKIQSRIWDTKFDKSIFANYFVDVLKSILNDYNLHKASFKYLFRYKEKDFPIDENIRTKPIKKRLRMLESLTLFLKPFLFFSLVFAFLRFWIHNNFLYDELAITLGEIQILLNSLKLFPFIKILNENKYLIFLIFGLITLFIPYLYNKENLNKTIKKRLKQIIIFISIITNVSFFGSLTGEATSKKTNELLNLKLEITSIHNDIFKKVFVSSIIPEIEDELKKEENLYSKEYERFKSKIDSLKNFPKDSILNKELNLKLLSKLKEVEKLTFKVEDFNSPKSKKSKIIHSEFNNFYAENYNRNSSYNEYGGYMGNKEKWNKKKGKEVLEKVENFTKNKSQNKYNIKLKQVVELFFDYGLDVVSSAFFDLEKLGQSSQKTLKKVVTILTKETVRNRIIEKTINILNSIYDIGKAENILQTNNRLYSFLEKEFKTFTKSNTAFYRSEVEYAQSQQNKLNRKKAIKRLDKKLNDVLNGIINSFEGNHSSNIYKEYKKEIITKYKARLNINQMPLNQLNKIIVSTSLIENKIKSLIKINNLAIHPFNKENCPICLFNGVISTLK